MAKELKWRPIDIDLHELMNYIRSMGAATLNEIKNSFNTDSASVRRAIGYLYHHQKVWLIAHANALYVTENTGKRGFVNIKGLRKNAGVQPKKRGPKPKGVEPVTWSEFDGQRYDRKERFVEVDGKLLIDFPEEP